MLYNTSMDLNLVRQQMQKVLDILKDDLATIRTGRATPSLIENTVVSVYGGTARMKIMELATVAVSDPQTLTLTPFDPSIIGEIAKGILEANIGFTPGNDGKVIRISIPPLSEERRQQLIHLMKQKLENGKVMVRQGRHEAMNEVKKKVGDKEISEDDEKRLEKEIQKITDEVTEQVDLMGKHKAEELLQI